MTLLLKSTPFLLRIILFAAMGFFSAKWMGISLFSSFMHVLWAVIMICLYVLLASGHLALEKFFYQRFNKENNQ